MKYFSENLLISYRIGIHRIKVLMKNPHGYMKMFACVRSFLVVNGKYFKFHHISMNNIMKLIYIYIMLEIKTVQFLKKWIKYLFLFLAFQY